MARQIAAIFMSSQKNNRVDFNPDPNDEELRLKFGEFTILSIGSNATNCILYNYMCNN